MTILHLFSGYNTLTTAAHSHNVTVVSLDIKNYKGCPKSTIISDFMDFDYEKYSPDAFGFIFVGFPCTTFSKAAGNFHFKNNIPVTYQAHNSLQMIDRLHQLLQYFSCDWMIENPTSALFSNLHFNSLFNIKYLNLIRVHQYNYGHQVFKQTDLLTTKNILWLDNPIYRINGKNACKKFANLSLKQRQSYPLDFCNRIINFILS